MKLAAVVKNVQQTTKFSSSFSFCITFQLDWLIISCNSRWKLSRSEFATAARTHLGLRLGLGDRDLGWALRLLLGLSVELCNVTLQHSHWTLLNVASRRWLDTSNCSNQILCSICILRFFCISSFLHYSFLHFYILLLHFSALSHSWDSLPLSSSPLSSSIFTFRICICSWLAWDTHKADARFAWSI